jgi:two-component sensor histidine kinase
MTQYIDGSWDRHTWGEAPVPKQPLSNERLLLRELTHRVNNELSAAIAAISLTAARSTQHEVKITLGRVLNRLENYAQVQRALGVPTDSVLVDAMAYLRQLCRSISLSKLSSEGIELVLIESPLQLSSEQCWRLGMIVSELITNSVRHAFSEGGGTIEVTILRRGNAVRCRVADDGSAAGTIRPANGLRIIQGLVKELGGNIDQRFTPQGTTSVVTLPLRPGLTTPISTQKSQP